MNIISLIYYKHIFYVFFIYVYISVKNVGVKLQGNAMNLWAYCAATDNVGMVVLKWHKH